MFDWNGTLVDDADRARVATNEVLSARGRSVLDAKGFAATFRLPLTSFFMALGLPVDEAPTAARDWNAAMSRRPATAARGSAEVLTECRAAGFATGVLSGAAEWLVRVDAESVGLASKLDLVNGGSVSKSADLRTLLGTREVVAYVGDTEFDVQAARGAGIPAIAVACGYRPWDALAASAPDILVRDLTEARLAIRDLLLSRNRMETIT